MSDLAAPRLEKPFYWDAFHELSTERAIGMTIGPIPMSKMWWWADHVGLTSSEARAFVAIIRQMDIAYLNLVGERQSKQSKKGQ
jgi:hypothetical protein